MLAKLWPGSRLVGAYGLTLYLVLFLIIVAHARFTINMFTALVPLILALLRLFFLGSMLFGFGEKAKHWLGADAIRVFILGAGDALTMICCVLVFLLSLDLEHNGNRTVSRRSAPEPEE